MSDLKKIFLFILISLFKISFCMEEEPPKKKQKVEIKKLPFLEIKSWQEIAPYCGYILAYETNINQNNPAKCYFEDDTKYALISKDSNNPVTCDLCHHEGYEISYFYKKNEKKVDIVLCHEKYIRNVFFRIRLLKFEEIKKILEMVINNKFRFGNLSSPDTKSFVMTQLKLKNLLPEEKRRYLYKKLLSVRLLLIGFFKDRESTLRILPKDIFKIIIKLLVYLESEDIDNGSLVLEL